MKEQNSSRFVGMRSDGARVYESDVHVLVRQGPYAGMYAVYERRTTYTVLGDGVSSEGGEGDPQPADGSVGTGEVLDQGIGQGSTDQGVPDGQAQEAGQVNAATDTAGDNRSVSCSGGNGGSLGEQVHGHSVLDYYAAGCSPDNGGSVKENLEEGQDKASPRQLPLL